MKKNLREQKRTRDKTQRRALRSELKTLQKEVREREEQTIVEVLQDAQIVCTTITGAAD